MTQENDLKSEFKKILFDIDKPLTPATQAVMQKKGFVFNPNYQYGLKSGIRIDKDNKEEAVLALEVIAQNCTYIVPVEYRDRIELVKYENGCWGWMYYGDK